MRVNMNKTKIMITGEKQKVTQKAGLDWAGFNVPPNTL